MDGSAHINDRDGNPSVFNLNRNDDGQLELNNDNARPDKQWNDDNEFVFRLRKSFLFRVKLCAVFLFLLDNFTLPSTKHAANFDEPCRSFGVMTVRDQFCLPSNLHQEFDLVELKYAEIDFFNFYFFFGKISDLRQFQ